MRQLQHFGGFWLAGAISVSVSVVAAQPAWAQIASVTTIQLKSTESGIEVILPGVTSRPEQIITKITGNSLTFVIPNAQLRLPQGNTYRQDNPTEEIATVTVTNANATSILVTIAGKSTAPKGEVVATEQGLGVNIASADTTAEISPNAEASETDSETGEISADAEASETEPEGAPEEEEIDVVVTATRTEESQADVSRSVTVVGEEQIQKQTGVSRDLGEILGRTVPGLGPANQSLSEFGQNLRGRNPLVLIDGVPQSTNRNASRNLRNVDPSVIDRVEVLRGPTALYGDGATGGIINIITRQGEEGGPRYRIDTGLTGAFDPLDDSLGGNININVSGKEDIADYLFSASFESIGSLFDAEGDRIPPDLLSSQGSLADTDTINLFGKVGWDLDDDQRLQLTISHLNTNQNTDFVTDPAVNALPPGSQKATTRKGLQLDDQSQTTNTFVNFDYTHANAFFNSRIHAQVYYRDYFTRFFPFDGRQFNRRTIEGFDVFQSRVESQRFGARLEIDTPIVADQLSLLSGLDYSNEDVVQPVAIFDRGAYGRSGGLVFNQIDDRPWVPPLKQTNLGLFGQLRWQPIEQLVLRGGVRQEQINVDVDNFTTLAGRRIEGGELDYDATLFNVGAVYKLTDTVSVFADFAQGFSVADVGLVLRDAPAGLSTTALNPEAQKVDSYEIGVRGEWDTVQASLAAFYNESDLGTTFDRNTLEIIRAPEKVYGLEAALDLQLSDRWSIGSTLSYVEGENDVDRNGEYQALNGFRINPLKLTAYVENETAPGWQNRLQLLYSGNRDRALEDGVDFRGVGDYVTLDLISSIKLGDGTLRLGIQNLLDNQYFTPVSQLLRTRTNDSFTASPGRTISLQYSLEF